MKVLLVPDNMTTINVAPWEQNPIDFQASFLDFEVSEVKNVIGPFLDVYSTAIGPVNFKPGSSSW